ncbi:hypothetical protein PO768_04145 [Paucibacter sp. XJ19-41]|nr:hypothetical protein [Paucibacter sp. XJ19-41]
MATALRHATRRLNAGLLKQWLTRLRYWSHSHWVRIALTRRILI